ncbi:MAG: hypothetical protein HC908_18370 [Calothrix sp. SM1_7_51]|nr:hypothetical protein [Calothrix sp. SM1_7_51]
MLKNDPHVTSIRVKTNIASVTIRYSERQLPISHWIDIMQSALPANSNSVFSHQQSNQLDFQIETQSSPKLNEKPLKIEDSAKITSAEKTEYCLQVSSLWANMKSPGLSYSLALMANMKS